MNDYNQILKEYIDQLVDQIKGLQMMCAALMFSSVIFMALWLLEVGV